MSTGPLDGLKVVEFAHIMAGPICGLMLADMGAEVVKVEKPQGGDDTRRFAPPHIAGESAAFMMLNRNKRGIALDLKTDEGREALARLIDGADILIENYRMGTMERLGLGYETLRERNPALIYVEVSGFGRTGPYAHRPGFDLITQGMAGLMAVTGEGPGRPPIKIAPPITDITAGIIAAMGALAAVVHRKETGEGQKVDTSLFEAGIVQTYWQSAVALATGLDPEPIGSAHPMNAPYQAFRTADGWINIGAANQSNWLKLVDILDAPDLATDPRFATNADRMANRFALEELLNEILSKAPTDHWLQRCEDGGLPAGPVLSITEMHADPQANARDMLPTVDHPVAGTIKTIGLPVKFSESPGSVRGPAPILGQHTADVLRELGYDEAAVTRICTAAGAPVS